MSQPLHILLIDDNPDDRVLVVRELRQTFPEMSVEHVTDVEQFTHSLETGGFDVVVTDYQLHWTDGLVVLRAIKARFPNCPVIMFTTTGSEEVAVEAMKSGLDDYVPKHHLSRLPVAVVETLKKAQLRKDYEDALQQLKASEERHRAVAEVVSDYAYGFRVEPDGRLLVEWATDALIRTFGYTAKEVEKQGGWLSLVHPDDVPLTTPLVQRLLEGQSETGEIRLLTRSGEVRWIRYYVRPVWDEDEGRVVRIYGAAQDVTQRKTAEDALRQQLMRINLLNQITRAIAERHDLSSIFRVVLARLEDHLPIDFGSVLWWDAPTNVMTVIARGPKSQMIAAELGVPEGTAISLEHSLLAPCIEGNTLYLPDLSQTGSPLLQRYAQTGLRSLVGVPLMVEGKVLGVLAVLRRMSDGFCGAEREFLSALGEHVALAAHHAQLYNDLQRAYDNLRQTQQTIMQQERLRALGEMASGIAHDINNALSPIAGYSDLLLISDEKLSDHARRYLETIRTASADIADTVARMRTFYRQRSEREILLPVDLNSIVRQVVDMTRPRWKDIPQQRGVVIDMTTECAQDLPLITGIESEIREALTNLIFNAVDVMSDGGTITITTRDEGQGTGDKGQGKNVPPAPCPVPHVVLEVSDTGVGMTEEVRQRCLEPFFSTKGERGTGLGLAMVFGTMQRHDGRIEIESALGKGTTVRLIFPMYEEQAAVRQENVLMRYSGPLLRVLCIDDEPLLRELVKEMLKRDGHTVEVAEGGQVGVETFRLAHAQGEPFDVVITDLGMPYMDGREVARMVKQESPDTTVVLLTGWGSRLNAEGSRPVHVDAVLNKPPRINQLRQALLRVMAKNQGGR